MWGQLGHVKRLVAMLLITGPCQAFSYTTEGRLVMYDNESCQDCWSTNLHFVCFVLIRLEECLSEIILTPRLLPSLGSRERAKVCLLVVACDIM